RPNFGLSKQSTITPEDGVPSDKSTTNAQPADSVSTLSGHETKKATTIKVRVKPPPLNLKAAQQQILRCATSPSSTGNSPTPCTMTTPVNRRPFSANLINRGLKRKLNDASEQFIIRPKVSQTFSNWSRSARLDRASLPRRPGETESVSHFDQRKSEPFISPPQWSNSTSLKDSSNVPLTSLATCEDDVYADLIHTSENETNSKSPLSSSSLGNVFFGPDFPKTITDLNRPLTGSNSTDSSAGLHRTVRDSVTIQFGAHALHSASSASSCLSTPTSSLLFPSPQSRMTPIAPKSPATSSCSAAPTSTDPTVTMACRFTPSKSVVEMRRKLVLDLFKQHGLFPSITTTVEFQQLHCNFFPSRQTLQLKIREVRQRIMQSTGPSELNLSSTTSPSCSRDLTLKLLQQTSVPDTVGLRPLILDSGAPTGSD
ncbi:hypothetical protein FGIG_04697, partial [Fasciola gigantica]